MALVLWDNSWVSVTEANNYLNNKFGADNWATLTNTQKEQLLITSFKWIFNYPYYSIQKDISGINITRQEKIKSAQIELAWWYYNYGLSHEQRMALQADGVNHFVLSKWQENQDKAMNDLPQNIKEILIDEYTGAGGYFLNVDREIIR